MQGLFDYLKNGAQSAQNSFGGLIAQPMDKAAQFMPYLGIQYKQGDFGTSEWMKKKKFVQSTDQSSIPGQIGGLLGTGLAMGAMGKAFNSKDAMKALAMAMLQEQALGLLKDNFHGKQNGPN